MEHTIRIIETEVRNQRNKVKSLEYEKTAALNAALDVQNEINEQTLKGEKLEKELNSLYTKFPSVERNTTEANNFTGMSAKSVSPAKKGKVYEVDLD